MTKYSELESEIIERHEVLIYRLIKNLPAQGEMSCKGDELRSKISEDQDDDPSVAKESEPPSSTSIPLGAQATAQGESS